MRKKYLIMSDENCKQEDFAAFFMNIFLCMCQVFFSVSIVSNILKFESFK